MTDTSARGLTTDEFDRLAEIASLDLFNPEVEALLGEFTGAVAARLGLPVSLVSIVLDNAQVFAASVGLEGWLAEAGGTPLEWAFCRHAVADREPFVVEDALTHPRVYDNPLVTEEGVRCYLGIPLITSRGHALGTLCALGSEARTFSEGDLDDVRQLAAQTVAAIEARAGR